MARSERLTIRDVRGIFRLVDECRELGADVTAWRQHLASGLCRLTGGQVGVIGEVQFSRWAPSQPLHIADVGWSCPRDRRHALEEFVASDLYGHDLSAERFFDIFPVRLRTVRREQIIPDAEWGQSVIFNDFVRRGGLDLGILSHQSFGDAGRVFAVILYPGYGEAPLTERSRRIVHLAQKELGPLLGIGLATAGEAGLSDLPPRWRQTLDCLLDGESEKQTASRLAISQQTVHQYVKGLYRHFGVSSRAELLAFFLRRYRAARPWAERGHPSTKAGERNVPDA